MLVALSGLGAGRAETLVELHRLGDSAARHTVWRAGPGPCNDDARSRMLAVGGLPMAHFVGRTGTEANSSARSLDRDLQMTTAGNVQGWRRAESSCGLIAHDNTLTAKTHLMLGGWR